MCDNCFNTIEDAKNNKHNNCHCGGSCSFMLVGIPDSCCDCEWVEIH